MKKLYKYIKQIYIDYRTHIPALAKISFVYYFLITIYPICIGLTFISRILNLDLNILYQFFYKYLGTDISQYIIRSLNLYSMNFSYIIVLFMSLYIVTKGIYEICNISKSLFVYNKKRHVIIRYIITIIKTIILFLLLVIMIMVFSSIPIMLLKDIEIFIIFYIVLFCMYAIIPEKRISIISVLIGTLIASIMMLILINGLQIYFTISDYTHMYGPLSSVVVVLLSLSYIGEVFYMGLYMIYIIEMKRS